MRLSLWVRALHCVGTIAPSGLYWMKDENVSEGGLLRGLTGAWHQPGGGLRGPVSDPLTGGGPPRCSWPAWSAGYCSCCQSAARLKPQEDDWSDPLNYVHHFIRSKISSSRLRCWILYIYIYIRPFIQRDKQSMQLYIYMSCFMSRGLNILLKEVYRKRQEIKPVPSCQQKIGFSDFMKILHYCCLYGKLRWF